MCTCVIKSEQHAASLVKYIVTGRTINPRTLLRMTLHSQRTLDAREAARHSSGQFGQQPHTKPEVEHLPALARRTREERRVEILAQRTRLNREELHLEWCDLVEDISEQFPCAGQIRFWCDADRDGEMPSYRIDAVYDRSGERISSELDARVEHLAARHEILAIDVPDTPAGNALASGDKIHLGQTPFPMPQD